MRFLYILCFYIFTKNIFSAYYDLILYFSLSNILTLHSYLFYYTKLQNDEVVRHYLIPYLAELCSLAHSNKCDWVEKSKKFCANIYKNSLSSMWCIIFP